MRACPKLVILDEPVSVPDVSMHAQIMNALKDLQVRHNLSYLLLAHHPATVRRMCDKVGVMYLGRIVEEAASQVGVPQCRCVTIASAPI